MSRAQLILRGVVAVKLGLPLSRIRALAQTDIQALRPTGLCRVGQLLLGAGIQWMQPTDHGMAAAQAQD